MIENSRRDELKLMYKCFVREESNLTALIHILNAFIEDNGKKIIEDENNKADEILYTQKLLDFKKDISRKRTRSDSLLSLKDKTVEKRYQSSWTIARFTEQSV